MRIRRCICRRLATAVPKNALTSSETTRPGESRTAFALFKCLDEHIETSLSLPHCAIDQLHWNTEPEPTATPRACVLCLLKYAYSQELRQDAIEKEVGLC